MIPDGSGDLSLREGREEDEGDGRGEMWVMRAATVKGVSEGW